MQADAIGFAGAAISRLTSSMANWSGSVNMDLDASLVILRARARALALADYSDAPDALVTAVDRGRFRCRVLDRAGAEETIGMVHLERAILGRGAVVVDLERAALAFRRAQRHLADAELEVLARIRKVNVAVVKRRRAG